MVDNNIEQNRNSPVDYPIGDIMVAVRPMKDGRKPRRCHVIHLFAIAIISRCNICASFAPLPPSIARYTRTSGMLGHEKIMQGRRSILNYELKKEGTGGTKLFKFASDLSTAISEGFGTRARNVASTMVVGDIVVPLCSNLEKRQSLAQVGIYAGVEYIVCDIEDGIGRDDTAEQVRSDRVATLKPAYPLRQHLERPDWPISISVSQVPLWLSKATYEAGTALGTIMLAGTYLLFASILAAFLRVVVVPSESMEPALMPGDVVLVTRSILTMPKVNDVVFFNPPPELDVAIANSKIGRDAAAAAVTTSSQTKSDAVPIISTKGKHLLKRVVGIPGDSVGVSKSNPFVLLRCEDTITNRDCTYRLDKTGEYSRPDIFPEESWNRQQPTIHTRSSLDFNTYPSTLGNDQFFVAGDNGFRSVDSRVWGPLEAKYIFGTANWVIYPLQHFGPISPGPFLLETGYPP